MKKLFLLAWPIALATVSCSNEEVVSVNNDANEIKFAVVAENGTRAQNLFCNLNKPTNFRVWASVGDGTAAKQYFANASYTDNGTAFVIDGGNTRYWPEAGTKVDFFAVTEEQTPYKAAVPGVGEEGETPAVPAVYYDLSSAFTWNITSASKINWTTRSTDAPAQTDLLYAYTRASRPTEGGTVNINFRHALAQIVFAAKNTNPNIEVQIDQVQVVNIAETGEFTMPYGADHVTDDNVDKHKPEGTYSNASVGSWNIQDLDVNTSANQTYTTTQWTPATKVTSTAKELTNDALTSTEHNNFKHSLLLIPQKTNAWNKTGKPGDASQKGSYFRVWCKIRNIATGDGNVNDTDDLYLWGTKDATVAVNIPFEANWEPGKKYMYTFSFDGSTTGGYDDNGKPVLIPISFKVTVDDFVKVDPDPVVDMK